MDSVLIYALLLLAIAIGWTLGYRFAAQGKPKQVDDWLPSVEVLLAQASDQSLERLLDVKHLDDDSVDLFLKLGRTLREKGEVERAIHLHQSLFARPDLDKSILQTLELELAVDFAHAGLLDRAERLFRELLESKVKGRVRAQASRHLIELYEEEGEWQSIVELYEGKQLEVEWALTRRVAHAVCELAEQAAYQGDYLQTQKLTRQALKIDPKCARAYVVLGDQAFHQNEHREAVRCYLLAVDTDSQALLAVLPDLVQSFKAVGDDTGLVSHLGREWKHSRYVPALVAKTKSQIQLEGVDSALASLLSELAKRPSNQGFFSLVEMVVEHKLVLDKSQLLILYDILRGIVDSEPKFVCRSCGFKAKEAHWRCPSCKDWASITSFVPHH